MLINVWFSGIHTKKCSFLDHVRPQKIMFSHVNFLFFAYFASEKCSFMNHTCSRSTSCTVSQQTQFQKGMQCTDNKHYININLE